MNSPGALLLKLRQTFGHGLRTAYRRDCVRPRILQTRPMDQTTGGDGEVHVLTSKGDWLNLLWALKSFYLHSDRRYALYIHDDGSLDAETGRILREHFPKAELIERPQADRVVLGALGGHPRCHGFRSRNHLAPKVFDFRHYLKADRLFLVDSDVLFFREPTELLRRVEDASYTKNSVNRDTSSAYTADPVEVQQRFGFTLEERFNSGLGLIHRDSLNLDWIEDFLDLTNIESHFWRIEQTLFALCSHRHGCELLPEDYDVILDEHASLERPVRHYVGAVRHLMYREGVHRLVSGGFFKALGQRS